MLQVIEILFCICIQMLYYGASITCVQKSLCACAPTSHIDAAFHLTLGESLRIEISHIHCSISTLAPPSLFPHDSPPPPLLPRQACLTSPLLPPPFLVHQDCSCISHAQVQPLDIEERYEDTSHHFLVSSPDAVGMRRGGGWRGSHPVITPRHSQSVTCPQALLAGSIGVSWHFFFFF